MPTTLNGRAAILGSRQKPAPMAIVPANLPPELPLLDRWLGWDWEWDPAARKGAGKWDKPPRNCLGGAGKSTDPQTWCDLSTALAAQEAAEVDGIGIALGDLGDGRKLTGVDLDDCRDPHTGELNDVAKVIVSRLPIYWEVSPSGTGLKGLCYGEKPKGRCSNGHFEMYGDSKYFTVTGQALPGCPQKLVDATEQLAWFHSTFIQPPKLDPVLSVQSGNEDNERVIEALNALKPARADDYEDWLTVGMAMHSHDPSLLAEWDQWSSQSGSYAVGVCHTKWESFNGSGFTIGTLFHLAKEDGWQPKPAAPPRRKITYKIITSAELSRGEFTTEYLIDDTMAASQPLIIAGPQKTLKTSLIIEAAIALATAGHFLGKLLCPRACRVAVMTGESGLGAIQDCANRICAARGKWLSDIANLFWTTDLPKFGDIAHMEALEEFLTGCEIEVLFIDPAYLALPGADAGNLFTQGELLRSVSELCQRLGVTMILAHHTKRNTGRDPFDVPELCDIAWSGFAEFARQWWLIGRREKYEPGTGDHKLWLSIGGSAGHSALWALDISEGLRSDPGGRCWEVSLQQPSEARDDVEKRKAEEKAQRAAEQLEADRKAVCRAMARHSGGMTPSAIRDAASISGRRFPSVLAAMLERDEIERCDVRTGNQKTPKEGYKLKGNEDA